VSGSRAVIRETFRCPNPSCGICMATSRRCHAVCHNSHTGDASLLVGVGTKGTRKACERDDPRKTSGGCASLYGRMIGYPMLKPHDLRHGVAMEVLEQRHDLEQVRALLGHARIDTTQIYTMIRPAQLKQAVSSLRGSARQMLASFSE